ncbi:hypothetical protein JTE90_009166 [Oedothorax gibbosus]|uniref:Uncharacterized protein n=1 Tax=Oedothorax gibbosus TaxID=931172 RepID=A0AAV6TPM4_9ARAC|nr:hypothetical protein JTE90_009166 [Oedothorax gibbosus]
MSEDNKTRLKCSLAMDEMAIRKEIIFQGGTQTGFVDYGTGFSVELEAPATEALVFMLVSIDSAWKIPVAYFFTNGLSSQQKAAFVDVALAKLDNVGVDVIAIVCDGLRSNLAMFEILGSKCDENGILKPFPHVIQGSDVFPVLDACHMLKLLRNLLAEKKVFLAEGRLIEWRYIELLQKVQDENLLKLATSINQDHIAWYKQKMKVKLAAQVFSLSVSKALVFLKEIMPEFKDVDATVDFIETINALFDCLNSRNPCGRFLKSPVRPANLHTWINRLCIARDLLLNLEYEDGKRVIKSSRKTVIVGFCTTIDSVMQLVSDLLTSNALKYVLTFKFSQDHIEVFFAGIRSKGGCNNNPSTQTFKAAYKQLIISRLQKVPAGNVSIEMGIEFLVMQLNKKNQTPVVEDSDDTIEEFSINGGHIINSTYVENSVMYIAGFVSKKISAAIKCEKCKVALFDTQLELANSKNMLFFNIKDNGGLSRPSKSVFLVCLATERAIRSDYFGCGFKKIKNSILKLQLYVLQGLIEKNIFEDLTDHILSLEMNLRMDDHINTLKKLIIEKYASVRFHHAAKVHTQKLRGLNVRHNLTKLILFKNQ